MNYTVMLEPSDYFNVLKMYQELTNVSVNEQYVDTNFEVTYSYDCDQVTFTKNLAAF